MTVTIIGCGGSGATIAAQLAKTNIDEIKIVDSEVTRADRLLQELKRINNSIEFKAVTADATNISILKKILKNTDVVINSASPACNIPIMKCCLYSGTNYIDLASDPFRYSGVIGETTLDDQLKLNKDFIKRDLVAITNAGASPGFSDLLCKCVVEKNSLDIIDSIKIYFGEVIKSNKLVLSWSPYVFLLESILPATIYKNNRITEINFEERQKYIDFPHPVGRIKVILLNGHPELRTIPGFVGIPVGQVEVGGGILLNKLQLDDVILEALSKRVKESAIFRGDIFEILSQSFESPDRFLDNYKEGIIKKELLSCLIEITGRRNKKKLKYNASVNLDLEKVVRDINLATSTTFMVSVVPSIITKKVLDCKIKERGVIAPAALSISSEIIEDCKRLGLNLVESSCWT